MPADEHPASGRRLPAHVAVHYLGCASARDGAIHMPGLVGPFVECLCESVGRVSIIAYERDDASSDPEDLTEYEVRANGNLDFVSLGPKGTWRTYPRRARNIAKRVSALSEVWDVIIFRMVNRRAGLVFRASTCPRIVAMLEGHSPSVLHAEELPLDQRLIAMTTTFLAERDLHKILRASGVAVVNSEWLADRCRPWAPNVRVLKTSGRRARFSYLAPDRMSSSLNVLLSGRITPSKGVVDAFETFLLIKRDLPGARLHVVGTGDALENLKERTRRHGLNDAVVFYGWLARGEELFSLYRQMDVLLSLSPVESLPHTVWEALANSVLVVCAPAGGLPEMFNSERELLFVPCGDPAAAAAAVRRLSNDPELRGRLIRNGYKRAKESELERSVDSFIELLTSRWPELQSNQTSATGA